MSELHDCFSFDVSERKALDGALVTAISGEQRRLGQELHDELVQDLTVASILTSELAEQLAERDLPTLSDVLRLSDRITASLASVRSILHGLSPLMSSNGGLAAALEALVERSSVSDTRMELGLTLNQNCACRSKPERTCIASPSRRFRMLRSTQPLVTSRCARRSAPRSLNLKSKKTVTVWIGSPQLVRAWGPIQCAIAQVRSAGYDPSAPTRVLARLSAVWPHRHLMSDRASGRRYAPIADVADGNSAVDVSRDEAISSGGYDTGVQPFRCREIYFLQIQKGCMLSSVNL